MSKSRLVVMGFVLLWLIFTFGCAIPLQTGIGKYEVDKSTGLWEKDYPKPMQDTWNAVLTVAKSDDFKLEITNQKFGAQESSLDAILPARFLTNAQMNVHIELVSKSDQVTTVKTRIGDANKENPLINVLKGGSESGDWQKQFHRDLMKALGIPRTMEWELFT